jgi:transposase
LSRAYSSDLRERVLLFLDKENDTKTASELFAISQRSIQRWVKQKNETGNIEPRQRKFAYKKIDDERLIKHVELYPDHFLYEVAEEFSVTLQAIFYALKRLKITRKKRRHSTKKEMKRKENSSLKS